MGVAKYVMGQPSANQPASQIWKKWRRAGAPQGARAAIFPNLAGRLVGGWLAHHIFGYPHPFWGYIMYFVYNSMYFVYNSMYCVYNLIIYQLFA